MNLFTKQKQIHRHRNKLMVTKGERGGGINQEFGINIYTLLYIKQTNNKDPLYSTGNYIQNLIINYNGKESEKEQIYVHMYIYNTDIPVSIPISIYIRTIESICCTPETNT